MKDILESFNKKMDELEQKYKDILSKQDSLYDKIDNKTKHLFQKESLTRPALKKPQAAYEPLKPAPYHKPIPVPEKFKPIQPDHNWDERHFKWALGETLGYCTTPEERLDVERDRWKDRFENKVGSMDSFSQRHTNFAVAESLQMAGDMSKDEFKKLERDLYKSACERITPKVNIFPGAQQISGLGISKGPGRKLFK